MPLELLLLLQSAIAPGFDLARLPRAIAGCGGDGGGQDIIVCARTTYRGQQVGMVADPPALLPKAEVRLFGNARASLHGDAVSLPGGQSNRVMATVKMPF